MPDFRATAPSRWSCGLALLLLIGLAVRLPGLSAPLLEGAAGKQTHTAMVARNLYRGRATLARPRVDDVGNPGYFVKELPVLPALAAALYRAGGGVDERFLRLIGVLAWVAMTPLVASLLRPGLGELGALVAGLWFVVSPMAIVYSRAAMNDALAVAGALAALAAALRWRRDPGIGSALLFGLLLGVSFLLKPHTALWLGPAAAAAIFAPPGPEQMGRPPIRALVPLIATSIASLALASTWYVHAAAIHRIHPVPGATVPEGWVAPGLLLDPALYAEIGRQALEMVFTPLGAVLAVVGACAGTRFSLPERALLAWGGGVVLQCLIFAPRMFDELSRGTEYYQLALVPTSAFLIARGVTGLGRWTHGRWSPVARAGAVVLLCAGALRNARAVEAPPQQYKTLLADCARVQAVTHEDDELLVLADRGGTVLYYCDRRGQTFSLGDAVSDTIRATSERATDVEIAHALTGAHYIYVPFPELLQARPEILDRLAAQWPEVPLPGAHGRLFARPRRSSQPGRRR